MATDVKFYPALKQILEREWDEYRRRNRKLSLREAASEMQMKSPSALHSWLRGERLPKSHNIKTLAEFFYPDDQARQKKFLAEINIAVTGQSASKWVDPLAELMNGRKKLKVGAVKYQPFSGDDTDFFNKVFDRFAAFASISELGMESLAVELDVVQQRLTEGHLDIVLGILATPDRALRMKFFQSPIKIPVNAVMIKHSGSDPEKLQRTLSVRPKEDKAEAHIYPIISETEVGGLHVRNFLNIPANSYKAVDYSEGAYANSLIELQHRSKPGGPTPIVVADEFMCMRVIKNVNGRQGNRADLIYREKGSLAGGKNNGSTRKDRPLMPRYRLCFAVNRNHTKWIDYLGEAFGIFLDANRELVASYYEALSTFLRHNLESALQGGVDQEVNTWLGFTDDTKLPDSDPWATIVERARPVKTKRKGAKRK